MARDLLRDDAAAARGATRSASSRDGRRVPGHQPRCSSRSSSCSTRDNLFTVGDELQSIYGFRHADVELFRERRATLAARGGARRRWPTNFRGRRTAARRDQRGVRAAFRGRLRAAARRARRRRAGRRRPRVELLRHRQREGRGTERRPRRPAPPAPAWRARRGAAAGPAGRASCVEGRRARARRHGRARCARRPTCRVYERALEERGRADLRRPAGAATGRPPAGARPRGLARRRSPTRATSCACSSAGLAAGAGSEQRRAGRLALRAAACARDAWWALEEACDGRRRLGRLLEALPADRRERARAALRWLGGGARPARRGTRSTTLIERAVAAPGYDLHVLALRRRRAAAGQRAQAACAWRASTRRSEGRDLRGFLDSRGRARASADATARGRRRVETTADLDAVRLMTIHAAKGLEFPVVCVADLGRGRSPGRRGRSFGSPPDGRVGLKLAPRRGGRGALDCEALQDEGRRRRTPRSAECSTSR